MSGLIREMQEKVYSASSAEKLGELGNHGFQWTPFRWRSLGLLLVARPPQGGQHVGERRFLLLGIPGAGGKTNRLVTGPVKPSNHQAIDDQGHRCRSLHRLG